MQTRPWSAQWTKQVDMSLILFDGLKWIQWHQFQTSNISNILFQNSNAMAIAGGKLLKRVQSGVQN